MILTPVDMKLSSSRKLFPGLPSAGDKVLEVQAVLEEAVARIRSKIQTGDPDTNTLAEVANTCKRIFVAARP